MTSLRTSFGTLSPARYAVWAVLLLLCLSSFAFGDVLSPEKLEKSLAFCKSIAVGSFPEWAEASFADPRTYNDMDGGPLAYVYSLKRDGEHLGYMTVSARDEFFPYYEYAAGPRPDWGLDRALGVVADMGYDPGQVEYIFVPPFDYLVEVKSEDILTRHPDKRLIVSLCNLQVCPVVEVHDRISAYVTATMANQDQLQGFWRQQVLSGKPAVKQAGSDVLIAKIYNTEAHDYEFTWKKGCGPTTITMLFGYHAGAWGYNAFWYDGPEAADWCTYTGTNAPFTIHELLDIIVENAQNIGYDDYGRDDELGGPGYEGCIYTMYGIRRDVANDTIVKTAMDHGYVFTTEVVIHDGEGVSSGILNTVQQEVGKNHPMYFGIGQDGSGQGWSTHAVLGVGYNYSAGAHEIIANNTWEWTNGDKKHAAMESFVDWCIITAAPLGFSNTPPELTQPDVNPKSAPPGSDFTFTVNYFDADESGFYVEQGSDYVPDFEAWFDPADDNGGNWFGMTHPSGELDYKGDPIAGNGLVDYETWFDMGVNCSQHTWVNAPEWPDPSDWWSSVYTPYNPKDGDSFIDMNGNDIWESERFDDENCNGMWDGDNGPFEGWVVVNNVSYPMLMVGNPSTVANPTPDRRSDAQYAATIRLGPGVQEYYFYFKDGNGGTARLPARGGTYKNLRVGDQYNAAPTLTDGKVLPPTGSRVTLFTYSVHYSDPDGDPPLNTLIFVDDVPHQMWLVSGTEEDGTYEYETFLAEAPHCYRFEFDDLYGKPSHWPPAGDIDGPVVLGGGQVPMLSDGMVSPRNPLIETPVTFTVRYTSPHDYSPISNTVVIDDTPFEMLFLEGVTDDGDVTAVPDFANFASGATYYFGTATLPEGNHRFYFSFIDETGGAGRLPIKGDISGPNVTGANTPPVLSDGKVDPASGTTSTSFEFSVRYSDVNMNPAGSVILYLDGDVYYTDLVEGQTWQGLYSVTLSGLTRGLHSYWFYAADSLGAETRLPGTPGDEFEGPYVRKTNVAPTLTNGAVSPQKGGIFDRYVFSIDYYDEEGDAPHLISVWLDSTEHEMSLASGEASDGTYRYVASPGTITAGSHRYYFFANDGYGGTARMPTQGYASGPIVQHGEEAAIPYWLVDDGFNIDTNLVMTNTGTNPVLATLTLRRFNGEEIPPYPIQITGHATRVFNLSDVDGVAMSDYGTGFISWKDGNLAVWCKLDAGTAYPVTLSGTKPGPLYLPFWQVLRAEGGNLLFDTLIATSNPSSDEASVQIQLYDEFGAEVVDLITLDLAPWTTKLTALSEKVFDSGIGSAELVFSSPLRIWVAMRDMTQGWGYELPVVDSFDPSPYMVPSWMNLPSMHLDTYVVFSNFGKLATSVPVMFYGEAGTVRGADIVTAPAHGLGIVQASRCCLSMQTGWAEASWGSEADMSVFAVLFNSKRSVFYPVPTARTFQPPFYIPYWEFDPIQGKDTYVYVRNPNDVPVSGTIRVNNRSGFAVGDFAFNDVGPGQQAFFTLGSLDYADYGAMLITSSDLPAKPLIAWAMLLDGNFNGCIINAQETLGIAPE